MKHALIVTVALVILLMFTVVEPQGNVSGSFMGGTERPVANVPVALRQINWLGPHGSGSCAWASLATDLNWEGEYALAKRIRATHGDGVSVKSLCAGLTAEHIPFAWSSGKGDVAFLEAALAGRRGVLCGVNFEHPVDDANHMVVLSHLDAQSAALIDPNYPSRDRWMTREEFLSLWSSTGSIAFVPLYSPTNPLAH
jgi:hypothetical protein